MWFCAQRSTDRDVIIEQNSIDPSGEVSLFWRIYSLFWLWSFRWTNTSPVLLFLCVCSINFCRFWLMCSFCVDVYMDMCVRVCVQYLCIYLHACGCVKELVPSSLWSSSVCPSWHLHIQIRECLSLFEAHDKIPALFKIVTSLQPIETHIFPLSQHRCDSLLTSRQSFASPTSSGWDRQLLFQHVEEFYTMWMLFILWKLDDDNQQWVLEFWGPP